MPFQWLRRFADDRRGSAAVVFAMVTPLLFVGTAVSVDYASTSKDRAKAQSAADAAAIAAVVEANRTGGGVEFRKEAGRTRGTAIFNAAASGLHISTLQIDISDNLEIVSVTAQGVTKNKIVRVTDSFEYPYKAFASANAVKKTPVCLLATDTAASPGITFKGNGSYHGTDCSVWSNSTSNQSILFQGSSSVTAKVICAAGNIRDIGNNAITPSPAKNCPPLDDPLATWPVPASSGACTYSNHGRSGGSITLSPGVYCGDTVINGDTIVLGAGIYVIQDGTMSVKGNTVIRGEGVLLLMSGNASLEMISSGDLKLSGQDIAEKNVVIAARTTSSTGNVYLSGNTKFEVAGSIYLPKHAITATGNSNVVMTAPQTTIIGKTITIDGSGSITFKGREIGTTSMWVDGSSFARLTQ